MRRAAWRGSRRQRWADREDRERWRAYRDADSGWQRHDAELRATHATVVSFHPDPMTAPPLRLGPDELTYLVIDGVRYVEAPQSGRLPVPHLTSFPVPVADGPLPHDMHESSPGTVVITSRRVVFLGGRGTVEWTLAGMTGLWHDPHAPLTLMEVSDRPTVAGLIADPHAAATLRLFLQMAIADAGYRRHALQAHLGNLIAANGHYRPAPPAAADPRRAPARVVVTRARLALTAAVVGALALAGAVAVGPAARSSPDAARFITVTDAADGQPDAAGSAHPAPASTVGPQVAKDARTSRPVAPAPTSRPAKTTRAAAPSPPAGSTGPSPSPTTAVTAAQPTTDLCGAPENPYGYTFCKGTRIRDPESGICGYFDCIDSFFDGKGFVVQCMDGLISLTGHRRKSCAEHLGIRRTVFQ